MKPRPLARLFQFILVIQVAVEMELEKWKRIVAGATGHALETVKCQRLLRR